MSAEVKHTPSKRAMMAAVEMEVHAVCSTTTAGKASAIDAHFPGYDAVVSALRNAIGALEFSRDFHSDLGNEDQAFAQDMLDAARSALHLSEGAA